jgi:hypothetical protein
MRAPSPVFCENAELMAEASAVAERLGLAIAAELSADPLNAAAHAAARSRLSCALCLRMPEPGALVLALDACSGKGRVVLGALAETASPMRGLAADLGIACTDDVEPALSALALLVAGLGGELKPHARKLSAGDRLRLEGALLERGGRVASLAAEGVAVERREGELQKLGGARAAAQAARSLRAAEPDDGPVLRFTAERAAAAREVLFGPPRLLSDPASKLALGPFGLPMPQEELCTSPSRAASEAARMGFPVRISLASPDLRLWDHPDLSVDGVDNAARVRDVYRQLESLAAERGKDARFLGVTVAETTLARALLRLSVRKLPEGRVLLRVGFADPHGAVSKDVICTALPTSARGMERALGRLQGEVLILGASAAERETNVAAFADLCTRAAAFVDTFRSEVARVELYPVALLVGGGAEVREAAVEVTDAFLAELA